MAGRYGWCDAAADANVRGGARCALGLLRWWGLLACYQAVGAEQLKALEKSCSSWLLLTAPCSPSCPALHRRACWARDGHRFCVPARRDASLLLLDFAASPAAGCYALRGEDSEQQQAVPSAVAVPLSQVAICAAAHPTQDLLVAGSLSSCLAVAGLL